MKQASEKRFKAAEIGQNVRVPIPELDRGQADHRNLVGVVLEVKDGFYKIGTKNGVLKSLYSHGQFDLCSEVFITAVMIQKQRLAYDRLRQPLQLELAEDFKNALALENALIIAATIALLENCVTVDVMVVTHVLTSEK